MPTEPVFINHDEVHDSIQVWCNEATQLFDRIFTHLDVIEARLGNLEARVSEWEVGPR